MLMKTSFLSVLCSAWIASMAIFAGGQGQAPKAAGALKPESEILTNSSAPKFDRSGRPDPFINPLTKRKKADADEEVPKGDAPPGIAGMNIGDVELLGLSLSSEAKIAAFRGTDKRVYFLHEGDRLFDGYLKSIVIDSALLIHETRLRSGKVMTQEITKRLRKQ
jgi:hypothetical protein